MLLGQEEFDLQTFLLGRLPAKKLPGVTDNGRLHSFVAHVEELIFLYSWHLLRRIVVHGKQSFIIHLLSTEIRRDDIFWMVKAHRRIVPLKPVNGVLVDSVIACCSGWSKAVKGNWL